MTAFSAGSQTGRTIPVPETGRVLRGSSLTSFADMAVAIKLPTAPLFVGAARSLINLIWMDEPDAALPDEIATLTEPAIVLLGSSFPRRTVSCGPSGWRCARSLAEWARFAVLHGSEGDDIEDYCNAVGCAAALVPRIAFIQCPPRHLHAWAALLEHVPAVGVYPPGIQPPPGARA